MTTGLSRGITAHVYLSRIALGTLGAILAVLVTGAASRLGQARDAPVIAVTPLEEIAAAFKYDGRGEVGQVFGSSANPAPDARRFPVGGADAAMRLLCRRRLGGCRIRGCCRSIRKSEGCGHGRRGRGTAEWAGRRVPLRIRTGGGFDSVEFRLPGGARQSERAVRYADCAPLSVWNHTSRYAGAAAWSSCIKKLTRFLYVTGA